MATSATGGPLLPSGAAPPYGDPLEDVVHDVIRDLTGITGKYIRPRWQPKPPAQPELGTLWCAFGIQGIDSDAFAWTGMTEAGEYILTRTEEIELLLSFYGPQAHDALASLRDGLQLAQNRATLEAASIAYIELTRALSVPALVQDSWIKRVDSTLRLRRRVTRTYAVLPVASAQVGLDNEHYITDIVPQE